MAFWDNVVIELEYIGMTNRALAEKCGFDASNIGRGVRLGSSPSVETAVRIAKVLNVSVEYLVSGCESNSCRSIPDDYEQIHLLHKYSDLLVKLDSLPDCERKPIIRLIDEIGKK